MGEAPHKAGQRGNISESSPDPVGAKRFVKVIDSYASAISSDQDEEARQAAMQAVAMAVEEATKNPTPSLLLKQKADDCEDRRDWVGAEGSYREVLAHEIASGNAGMIAKAHLDLSRLFRLLGRQEEAWQAAHLATASARRTDLFPVLVMALGHESHCALDRGEALFAKAAAKEALRIIEQGKIYDLMRAKARVTLARCTLAGGDLSQAAADLIVSWELLNNFSAAKLLVGSIFALANWWEVKSILQEREGTLVAAQQAMERALGHFRLLQGPYALFAVAGALERVAALAKVAGDSVAAERAENEAKAIRADLRLPAKTVAMPLKTTDGPR